VAADGLLAARAGTLPVAATTAQTPLEQAEGRRAAGRAGRGGGAELAQGHRRAHRWPADQPPTPTPTQVRPARRWHQRRGLPGPRDSAEELEFLAAHVVNTSPESGGLTYIELEHAPAVLCVALDPEEEASTVFLRLRKANRHGGLRVFHLGQWTTPSVTKTGATLIPAVPGTSRACSRKLGSDVLDLLGQEAPRSWSATGRPTCQGSTRRSPSWPGGPALGSAGSRAGPVTRRAGRRRGADPAARWPPGHRRGGPRRGRRGLGPRQRGRPARRAGPGAPRRSSRPPPRASWPACWSAGWTRTTCPTRRRRWPACAARPSWSAWSCTPSAVTELADVVLPVAPDVTATAAT